MPVDRKRSHPLTREDWIAAARKMLIKSGIDSVKVEPLARALSVTPGSFYWHFPKREDLHGALLDDWLDVNTSSFHRAVEKAGPDPRNQYMAFFGVWILEKEFDPKYDRAVREWANKSKKISNTLTNVDLDRILLLNTIFNKFGYNDTDSEMRARVTYYHQAGYYALNIRETLKRRIELGPAYAAILTGLTFLDGLTFEQLHAAYAGRFRFE